MTGDITFQDDGEGITTFDGGKFYKKAGTGIVTRLSNGGQRMRVEDVSGNFLGTYWDSGNLPITASHLSGTSANIQNQLSTLSASKQNSFSIAQNQVAVGGTNTISGSSRLTFDGLWLSVSGNAPAAKLILDNTGTDTGIRFNDSGVSKWFVGSQNGNIFRVFDYSTTNSDILITSGSAGLVTLGSGTKKVNLPSLNTSAVVVTDGSKNLVSSNITTTQLGYLSTTSADVQTQINNILNGTSGKFTSAISINASIGQTFTLTHNLGYLRPIIKVVDETNHQDRKNKQRDVCHECLET
jgi:hypothetical protein